MVKNHPNANVLNRMLYENIAAIEQTELGLWQQGKSISLDLLKNSIDKPLSNVNPEKRLGRFYKNQAFQKVQKRNVHEKR